MEKSILTWAPIQLLICVCMWLILFVSKGHQFCSHKLIRIMLFFNIIIFNECLHHSNSVISSAIVLYVIECGQKQHKVLKQIMMIWLLIFEPMLLTVCMLDYCIKYENRNDNKVNQIQLITIGLKVMGLLGISLLSIFYLGQSSYFIHHFAPNSGIIWVLYSHLFQRYLFLFQLTLFTLPFICVFPLNLINCDARTKIAIQWFICIFLMPNTTLIHIWCLFALESRVYQSIMDGLSKHKQVIWNTLTIMATVVSICSFCFYERMISIWTNTHLISVGYYFLQILLFWGVHAVYLSQALIIMDQPVQKPHRNLMTKIRQYFQDKIKEL